MYLWLISACALWAVSARASVVRTSSGPVRGRLVHDRDCNVSYYAYQGIPYAETPTGYLRFKPPVPKRPWNDTLDASEPGAVCPQPEGKITRELMSEDCLYLNVFVPAVQSGQELMPVLVYVHGGIYKSNSGNIDIMYGPQLLLKRGIIYVSMNYRLGALGYLSLDTDEAPGNAGLKDLLLALQWIKQNIHAFGGSSITLGGQSSGAAMVHHMLLTEKSSGLFDRAILNSGSATTSRFLSKYPRKHAYALADMLGLSSNNDSNIIKKLREADVFDIIDAQENLYKNSRNIMTLFSPFVPCVESQSEHAVLTRNPTEIIGDGIPQNVPILAGINSREGAFLWPTLHEKSSSFLQENLALAIPGNIEYPVGSDMYDGLVNSVKREYFNDIHLTNWTLDNFYDLLSDTQYAYGVGSWLKKHKGRTDSNEVFYYLFNFEGDLNWSKINYNISFPGAVHTDEIGYLFVNLVTRDKLNNIGQKSQQTLDNMLKFVSSFIKYGEPGFEWEEYGSTGRHLVLNERPERASREPFARRFAFWTDVYKQYHRYLQNRGPL